MQNLRWLILFLLLAASASGAVVVRLVTWNLEWFPGGKPSATPEERERHFLQIANSLPQLRADVLVLQEVRDNETAERLARLLPGFQVHVTSAFKDPFTKTAGEQQITLLSRFPANAAWAEAWKRGWASAPRGYAYARLMVSGRPLHIYGLHLKSNLGNPVENTSKREDAMEQLLGHIRDEARPGEPVVVAGDFNTSKEQVNLAADTTLIKIEKEGFFWSFAGIPPEQRVTVPSKGRYPDACFDHIYVRGLGKPVALVLKNLHGSDHLPVAVDLQLDAP